MLITICTKNRKEYFGKFQDCSIKLSQVGVLAYLMWNEIKNHTETIISGEYVIMPNHVHGILILNGNSGVPGAVAAISPKSGSVSRIVGSYKSAVTKYAHRLGYEFAWQPRFYDHIIRDRGELNRITKYIIGNPKNWKNDSFCTEDN